MKFTCLIIVSDCMKTSMKLSYLSIFRLYEGMSVNNQPIPFPMDRDSHDFHALFHYVLYMGTKLHAY